MSNKPKIAIVGVGRWGKNLLKEFDQQADVVWVCHNSSDDTNKFLSENFPSVKITTNFLEILEDKTIDAVVIATPTVTHFEIAEKAMGSGKHVFLEKPGTTKSQNLEKLAENAREKKLIFVVGYEFPHHPASKKLSELLNGKKIKSLLFLWQKWGTFYYDSVPHLLSHDVSVSKYLGVENILPITHKRIPVISDSDIIETEFSGDNDVYIKSIINRASPKNTKELTVILEDTTYVWSNNELFEIDKKSETFNKIDIEQTTPVANEIRDFLSSIESGNQPISNGVFAVGVYKIIESVINLLR